MLAMEPSPGACKKATAVLDEAARARLRGQFVSDAAPSPAPRGRADADDDLADLVDEFYNGYGGHGTDRVAAAEVAVAPRPAGWEATLRVALANAVADAVAARIRAEAEPAVRDAGPAAVGGGGGRKRLVDRLRARGLNAGLCRSSWKKTCSIPAPGTYEYVDVTVGSSPSASRYIVEANLAAEFDIAKPSAEYQDLLRSLPLVLVARPEAFEQVAAAAESIRGAGMHVAPWRRARYVQAKWSAQYERVEAVTPVATAGARQGAVTPVANAGARKEAGARAIVHGRRPGSLKNCGMEMGRWEGVVGREALVSVRPLFR